MQCDAIQYIINDARRATYGKMTRTDNFGLLFEDDLAGKEAIIFGVIVTVIIFINAMQWEKSKHNRNMFHIRHETEKERDFFEIQNLARTGRTEDLKKAIQKNLDFYSNYLKGCRERVLDYSILLADAMLAVDIKSKASVAEVFRLARLVAPEKERAYFSRSEGNDPIPEALYGILKRRTDFLGSQIHAEATLARECAAEIILHWQQFFDICTSCGPCSMDGHKFMELSNHHMLPLLNHMVQLMNSES